MGKLHDSYHTPGIGLVEGLGVLQHIPMDGNILVFVHQKRSPNYNLLMISNITGGNTDADMISTSPQSEKVDYDHPPQDIGCYCILERIEPVNVFILDTRYISNFCLVVLITIPSSLATSFSNMEKKKEKKKKRNCNELMSTPVGCFWARREQ